MPANPSGKLIAQRRQAAILKILDESAEAGVGDLSRELRVSVATVRGDLEKLAQSGKLIRIRGGAIHARLGEMTADLNARATSAQIALLARTAASLVSEGESIILDGGPLAKQIVMQLRKVRQLTVLTNDPALALFAAGHENLSVIVPGGIRLAGSDSIAGPLAAKSIQRFSADKYFLRAPFFNAQRGVFGFDNDMAERSRQFAAVTRQVIVLAGNDVFSRPAPALCCPVESISGIISSQRFPGKIRNRLQARGIILHLAGAPVKKAFENI